MMENAWDREWIRETEKRVNARMMDMKNTGMEEKFPVSLIDMDVLGVASGRGPVRDVPELSDGEGSAGFGVSDRVV